MTFPTLSTIDATARASAAAAQATANTAVSDAAAAQSDATQAIADAAAAQATADAAASSVAGVAASGGDVPIDSLLTALRTRFILDVDFTALANADWLTTPPTSLGGVSVTPTISGWTSLDIVNGTGLVAVTSATTGNLELPFNVDAIAQVAFGRSLRAGENLAMEVQLKSGESYNTNDAAVAVVLYTPSTGFGIYSWAGRKASGGAANGVRFDSDRLGTATTDTWATSVPRSVGFRQWDPGRSQHFNSTSALPSNRIIDTVPGGSDISGTLYDLVSSNKATGTRIPVGQNPNTVAALWVKHGTSGTDTITVERFRVSVLM